jgi:hypothetical protein
MKITIAGAALIIAAAIVVVLVVRVLTSKGVNPTETGSALQTKKTGQAYPGDTQQEEQQ